MFDRPADEDLLDQVRSHRQDWFKTSRDRRVALVGGGLDALIAGALLESERISTVILMESDYPGGRLTWETGPVPIFSPATRQLEELGFDLEGNSPFWLDRYELLSFFVETYLEKGGLLVGGVYLDEELAVDDGNVSLSITAGGISETLDFEYVVLTLPEHLVDPVTIDCDDPLEYEVKGTTRRSEGLIGAGLSVLPERLRKTSLPLESAHLLSGRKASEILLDDLSDQ